MLRRTTSKSTLSSAYFVQKIARLFREFSNLFITMAENVTEEARLQFLAQIATMTNRRNWNGKKLQLLLKAPNFGDLVAGFINSHEPVPLPETLPEPTTKFALSIDLGIITVPADYVHGTCLKTFFDLNRKKFYDVNTDISDTNFPTPSRILKPGDKLHVRAYNQIVSGTTTSEERMAFLTEQKANVYTGAQGASLVFEQKRDQLPKGKWYASFDEAENLYKDADGDRRVPNVAAYSDGVFDFDLGNLEDVWDDDNAFLGFYDVTEE
ncbi:MAG: hypothetical protein KBB54_02440 [Candidatus Pacebacteria bacterium]|nr:hypothetical protein [Candidatus Paceibacterota bacterium]MBP9818816.1 hypothetical protein [Candidatus Paceibacterota bacterium]